MYHHPLATPWAPNAMSIAAGIKESAATFARSFVRPLTVVPALGFSNIMMIPHLLASVGPRNDCSCRHHSQDNFNEL
jgi:hypothetical protein